MRVLVLGSGGMLGSMIKRYLSENRNIQVSSTNRAEVNSAVLKEREYNYDIEKDPISVLEHILLRAKPDYIINCIGVIKPGCKIEDSVGIVKAIKVNALFPHELSNVVGNIIPKCRILQIATDCVYDGLTGFYDEFSLHNPIDVYGKTKSLGEVVSSNFLNIRCSIIGHELKNCIGLLEWFLSHKDGDTVNGYDHHYWNGVTTLQFAQLCEKIIVFDAFDEYRKLNHTINYVINESVSKFVLLGLINNIYGRKINILNIYKDDEKINRILKSNFQKTEEGSIEEAIRQLKIYNVKSLKV